MSHGKASSTAGRCEVEYSVFRVSMTPDEDVRSQRSMLSSAINPKRGNEPSDGGESQRTWQSKRFSGEQERPAMGSAKGR